MKAVMDRMQRISKAGILKKAEDINDYGKIKGDLFIRLLNREIHRSELNDVIYREMGDICNGALYLHGRSGRVHDKYESKKLYAGGMGNR